jgi:uncharacterized protein (TIGR02391 family)
MSPLPEEYIDVLRRLLAAQARGEFQRESLRYTTGGFFLRAGETAIPVDEESLNELVSLGLIRWAIEPFSGYVTEQGRTTVSLHERASAAAHPPTTDDIYTIVIADPQLRERCHDLLAASDHYDRAIAQACLVLEHRVRSLAKADATVTAVPLMEQAFSPKDGPLPLSPIPQEQLGAMQIYRGMMAFFRNSTGHHIVDSWSRDDAVRFVGWVDLLLKLAESANPTS